MVYGLYYSPDKHPPLKLLLSLDQGNTSKEDSESLLNQSVYSVEGTYLTRESLTIFHTAYGGYPGNNLVEIHTVNIQGQHISRFYKNYKKLLTLDTLFVVDILLHFHTIWIIFLDFCSSSELVYSHYKYLHF